MDYVVDLLRKAKGYGFQCFIDPHQDVVGARTLQATDPLKLELIHMRITTTVFP